MTEDGLLEELCSEEELCSQDELLCGWGRNLLRLMANTYSYMRKVMLGGGGHCMSHPLRGRLWRGRQSNAQTSREDSVDRSCEAACSLLLLLLGLSRLLCDGQVICGAAGADRLLDCVPARGAKP